MSPKHDVETKVIRALKQASKSLNFELTAPFVLEKAGCSVHCLAFLPHFGSSRGMVVGATCAPDFSTDKNLVECARKAGMGWSFINIEEYSKYGEESFREMLLDWGFFGPTDKRPVWMNTDGSDSTESRP